MRLPSLWKRRTRNKPGGSFEAPPLEAKTLSARRHEKTLSLSGKSVHESWTLFVTLVGDELRHTLSSLSCPCEVSLVSFAV